MFNDYWLDAQADIPEFASGEYAESDYLDLVEATDGYPEDFPINVNANSLGEEALWTTEPPQGFFYGISPWNSIQKTLERHYASEV